MNNLLSRTYRAPYYLFAFKKNKYIDKLLPVGGCGGGGTAEAAGCLLPAAGHRRCLPACLLAAAAALTGCLCG